LASLSSRKQLHATKFYSGARLSETNLTISSLFASITKENTNSQTRLSIGPTQMITHSLLFQMSQQKEAKRLRQLKPQREKEKKELTMMSQAKRMMPSRFLQRISLSSIDLHGLSEPLRTTARSSQLDQSS